MDSDYSKEIEAFKEHFKNEDYLRFMRMIIERVAEVNKTGKREFIVQFDMSNPLNDINLYALFYNNFDEVAKKLENVGYRVEKSYKNGKMLILRW